MSEVWPKCNQNAVSSVHMMPHYFLNQVGIISYKYLLFLGCMVAVDKL